jgi:hypothetical protein
MSQEYLDMMMPIDYTPEAFQYVNRRSYDKWRMVGMQFSHTFVGGVTAIGEDNYMFNAGRLKGFVDGCKVIEEINQNNQIVGRGGWYFRAKRAEADVSVLDEPNLFVSEKFFDVTDLDKTSYTSAVYGIMGHCAQVDAEREVTGSPNPGIEEIEGMTYKSTWASLVYSPMRKNWGVPQGFEMCACAGQNSEWGLMAFVEVLDTVSGKKKYFVQGVYEGVNDEYYNTELRKAERSRTPGFFSSWYYLGGGNTRIYRTCEANLWIQNGVGLGFDTKEQSAQDLCLDYSDSVFHTNIYPDYANQWKCNIVDGEAVTPGPGEDVPLTYYDDWRGPIKISQMYAGVLVKLTSLPSCVHHDKLIKRTRTKFANNTVGREKTDICLNTEYDGYDPTQPFCTETLRCERAVLRIMPVCGASIGYMSPNQDSYTISKQWPTLEVHYDRWDKALNGNYKVFDERLNIPEARMRVRIISHNLTELKKIFDEARDNETKWLTEDCMTVQYSTGGDESGVVSDSCGCNHIVREKQEENYFPIRPFNQFKYAANDFSCEKTCIGQA